jgi:hypothetical protein
MERSLTAEPTKEATIWIKLHHGAEVKIKAACRVVWEG